jgi:hypothetical protein
LVDLNASATAAILIMGNVSAYYTIHRGHDFMWVFKWSSSLGQTITTFIYEKTPIADTDVVLSLGLTCDNANVRVTARVLDKTHPSKILYQRSSVDTPNADPALTAEELHSISGMNQPSVPDLPGAPVTTGGTLIGVWQDNCDGKQPAAIAIFDNLELRKQEVPQLAMEQAARLSWPAPGGVNYTVQGAPSVLGPWLQVQELSLPDLQQMTVPATEAARFFRLLQVP